MCESCKVQIVNFYSLKEKCKKSELLLRQVFLKDNETVDNSDKASEDEAKNLEKKNETEEMEITENEGDAKVLENILSEEDHVCEICDEIFDTFELLEKHSETHAIQAKETKTPEITKSKDEKTTKIQENSKIKQEIEVMIEDDEDDEVYNEKLTMNLDQTSEESAEDQKYEEMIEDDIFSQDIGFLYECDKCGEQFDCNDAYVNHCMTHDFFCVKCGQFLNEEDAEKHFANHDLMDNITTTSKSDLFCVTCNKRVKNKQQLDTHVKMHETINIVVDYIDFFTCDECRTMFLYEEELAEHKKKHPKKNSPSKDLFVDDKSCTDYQFLDDEKEPGEDAIYSCGICEKFSDQIPGLKQHIALHSHKFSCPFSGCGCQYDVISRLHLHIQKKHFQGNTYNCDHCKQFAFSSFDNLQKHMKNDCKERKFDCTHCNKKFFSRKALMLHIKHSKEKKYACGFCGKLFSQQGELNIHHRSHTNEKPYQCTVCGKSYKTSSMRTAHMDTHIIGKTFQVRFYFGLVFKMFDFLFSLQCNICDKKLQTRVSYRNHMNRHSFGKRHVVS